MNLSGTPKAITDTVSGCFLTVMNSRVAGNAQRNNVHPVFRFIAEIVMVLRCGVVTPSTKQRRRRGDVAFSHSHHNSGACFYLDFISLSVFAGALLAFSSVLIATGAGKPLFTCSIFMIALFTLVSLVIRATARFAHVVQTIGASAVTIKLVRRLKCALKRARLTTAFLHGVSPATPCFLGVWAACTEFGFRSAHDFRPSPHLYYNPSEGSSVR